MTWKYWEIPHTMVWACTCGEDLGMWRLRRTVELLVILENTGYKSNTTGLHWLWNTWNGWAWLAFLDMTHFFLDTSVLKRHCLKIQCSRSYPQRCTMNTCKSTWEDVLVNTSLQAKAKGISHKKDKLFIIQLHKCILCIIKLNKAYTAHNYNNIIASLFSEMNIFISKIHVLCLKTWA